MSWINATISHHDYVVWLIGVACGVVLGASPFVSGIITIRWIHRRERRYGRWN